MENARNEQEKPLGTDVHIHICMSYKCLYRMYTRVSTHMRKKERERESEKRRREKEEKEKNFGVYAKGWLRVGLTLCRVQRGSDLNTMQNLRKAPLAALSDHPPAGPRAMLRRKLTTSPPQKTRMTSCLVLFGRTNNTSSLLSFFMAEKGCGGRWKGVQEIQCEEQN